VQHHIFLSYSRRNSDAMQRIKRILVSAGFRVWTDEGIEPGSTSWKMEIEKAIQATGCFLCVCTPDSKNSRWVNTELQRAEWHKKPIYLILAEGEPIDAIPFGYETHQLVDIRTSYKREMVKLLMALMARFGKSPKVYTGKLTTAAQQPARSNPLDQVKAILPEPFEWCAIPGGEVTLDEGGYVHSNNRKSTVQPFQIAKYPVTNAQFGKFIEAGGYDSPQWWTVEGWQRKQAEGWTKPRFWQDRKWNGEEHPVVGVSWFEAVAFCNWLSEAAKTSISLPTDQQWQRAAQGDDGRTYPWGEQFDSYRANTNRDDIESTTPVTQYEGKGDSPYGVVDMAGNVWEFCLTEFEGGVNGQNGVAWRVLRGGSWNNIRRDAQTTSRFSTDPNDWYNDIGFRIVGTLKR